MYPKTQLEAILNDPEGNGDTGKVVADLINTMEQGGKLFSQKNVF
jgi:hypothetical protein